MFHSESESTIGQLSYFLMIVINIISHLDYVKGYYNNG